MNWAMDPIQLNSETVTVRTLRPEDIDLVAPHLVDLEGWAGTTWGITCTEKARAMLERQLEAYDRQEHHPLVYFYQGEVAGFTCLHGAIPRRKALEIGFTLVNPRLRRTRVNTEVKYLLFRHSFETLGCVRVELRVDALNFVSQTAVLRLGARFEGKLDHWVVREDDPHPVGHMYSVGVSSWPGVKARLEKLRAGEAPEEPRLPLTITTPRLRLERARLSHVPGLLAVLTRLSPETGESFPALSQMREERELRAYIAERMHAAAENKGYFYAVIDRASNLPIGHVQIKDTDWQRGTGWLGYLLDEKFHRRGLGTEMVREVLKHLEPLRRLAIHVLPSNAGSLALAHKLGFEKEGFLRGGHWGTNGTAHDVVLLARVTKAEKEKRPLPKEQPLFV